MSENLFRNRIIGYGVKPADQFTANELNFRTHPQRQRDAVNASLRELGWIGVVIENVVTGNLIDGHERIWQALRNNGDVPFIQVELSEEEERLALATYDPLGAMASVDADILAQLLDVTESNEKALQELMRVEAAKAGLLDHSIDPNAEWTGMPAYEQDDVFGAIKTIKVHFASKEDIQAFAGLIGQTVTLDTKFLWYPQQQKENLKAYVAHES